MEKVIEVCDQCGKTLDDSLRCDYITLPIGDLDNAGIWFGTVGEYLWFTNQKFCGWRCFLAYLDAWYGTKLGVKETK